MGSTLKGKSAIVTGATSGIGNAIASALAEEGCNVMFNGFGDREDIEDFRQRLSERHGVNAVFESCDLTDITQISAMVDTAVETFGKIDILVNNAGGASGFAPIHELSEASWQEASAWILDSCFWATRRVLPNMLARGWGRIMNVSSVEGSQISKKNVALHRGSLFTKLYCELCEVNFDSDTDL